MRILLTNNINFANSTKSQVSSQNVKKQVDIVHSKEQRINKNNRTANIALGLVLASSVVMWLRTDPTRIQKVVNSGSSRNKGHLLSGSLEIEIKNFTNDKNVKSLEELSGLEKIKNFIHNYVVVSQNPEVMLEHKIQKFSSLLFWGVPGTGKTSAAKGIAKTLGADYVQIDKEFFDSKFVAEGSQRLAEVFDQIELHAKKNLQKKVVVFMDEIDGTISIDKGTASRHSEDLINTLKKGMTYLQEECDNIIFIGATNKDPNGIKSDNASIRLNPAILSRFKYQIEVGLPHQDAICSEWIKLTKTASGKEKFTVKQNEIISQKFHELGMSYRDIVIIADKLNLQDSVEFCQKNSYNSRENLIKVLLEDEKIGYDPVKKQNMPKEKFDEIINLLEKELNNIL